MPRVDGDLGQATLAAVKAHPDHDVLIAAILQRRLGMLKQLKTWPTFGKGWSARIASCKAIGQAWATGSVGPAPVAAEHGNAKASVADVDLPSVPEEAGINTGAAGGGLAVSVQTASSRLEPLLGTSKTLDLIYAALTVAGVAIVIGGGLYWLWAKHKRKAAERAWSGEATADLDPLTAGA
jgi:lysozyme family protein